MKLNKVIIGGRLTADPELRQTQTGASVLRITVAVDRNKPSNGGEAQTDFIEVSAFDKRAEMIARNFRKGSNIVVVGRLQVRRYETKAGEKRQSTEVAADEIHFVDKYDPTISEQSNEPVVSIPSRRQDEYNSPAYNGGKDTGSSFVDIPDASDLPF